MGYFLASWRLGLPELSSGLPLKNSSPPKPGSIVSKRTAGKIVCSEVKTAEPMAVMRSGLKLSMASVRSWVLVVGD